MLGKLTKQLEFSLGMFHTTAMEIAGNATAKGGKGNSRAGANGIRNNIEFQRLIMDVEGEMNDIRNHKQGKSLADAHPKMQKTLELVSFATFVKLTSAPGALRTGRGGREGAWHSEQHSRDGVLLVSGMRT